MDIRQDGKNGLKIRPLTVGLTMGLLALACVGYACRLRVAAMVWHWRHGNVVVVDGYEIPVPSQWLARDQDLTSVQLVNTAAPQHAGDAKGHSIVNVIALQHPPGHPRLDPSFWASSLQHTLQREGVRYAVRQQLRMGNDTVICLGGRASELTPPLAGVIDLMCMSSRGLSLSFTGAQADIPRFYAIVQEIRRK